MTSNYNTVNVEKINRVNSVNTLQYMELEITPQYITLTGYYIVCETFR